MATWRALLPVIASYPITRAQTILAEKPEPDWYLQLATLVKQNYLWLDVREVRSRLASSQFTIYSFPETHSFVADGFVQHNSQDISPN